MKIILFVALIAANLISFLDASPADKSGLHAEGRPVGYPPIVNEDYPPPPPPQGYPPQYPGSHAGYPQYPQYPQQQTPHFSPGGYNFAPQVPVGPEQYKNLKNFIVAEQHGDNFLVYDKDKRSLPFSLRTPLHFSLFNGEPHTLSFNGHAIYTFRKKFHLFRTVWEIYRGGIVSKFAKENLVAVLRKRHFRLRSRFDLHLIKDGKMDKKPEFILKRAGWISKRKWKLMNKDKQEIGGIRCPRNKKDFFLDKQTWKVELNDKSNLPPEFGMILSVILDETYFDKEENH